jgi:hypothetical protein
VGHVRALLDAGGVMADYPEWGPLTLVSPYLIAHHGRPGERCNARVGCEREGTQWEAAPL